MLVKWNWKLIAVSFLLNLTRLELPHIKKGRLYSMAKSKWKSEFYPYLRDLFNRSPEELHAKREFRALQYSQGST